MKQTKKGHCQKETFKGWKKKKLLRNNVTEMKTSIAELENNIEEILKKIEQKIEKEKGWENIRKSENLTRRPQVKIKEF